MSMHAKLDDGNGFVPRRVREQSEREETLRAALLCSIDDATDIRNVVEQLRRMVLDAFELAGQERAQRVIAEGALEWAIDAIVAFVARHPSDPDGAVEALKNWVERLGA